MGPGSQSCDASDDTRVKSLKSMHGPGLWTEKGIFVTLALPDLFQATLHLLSSFWDKMENTGYEALIMEFIRMNRDILLHCISAKIQKYFNSPTKVADIGRSNQVRMCSLAAKSVIEDSKLGKGWNAVSMSAAIGNSYPTAAQYNKGMQATFIDARFKDSIEFEENPDHVVSAVRYLL